jgi:hypothetical protein
MAARILGRALGKIFSMWSSRAFISTLIVVPDTGHGLSMTGKFLALTIVFMVLSSR